MNKSLKLNKKEIEDIVALTPMQEGMLFHYLKNPGADHYFEQLSLNITGEIDVRCFEQAWNFVIRTNRMLRTVFHWEAMEKPVQIILKEYRLHPQYYDFSEKYGRESQESPETVKSRDRKRKFNSNEVPFRVTLCKTGDEKYIIIISNHHILYDGWSSGIILREFFRAYDALINGKEPVKPLNSGSQFKEFVKWMQCRDIKKQEKFWNQYLEGFDAGVEFPIIKSRRKAKAPDNMGNYPVTLDNLKIPLDHFVRDHKITLASLFYSAWGILLQSYTDSWDVVFGTTVANRPAQLKGIENVVGLFINTVPLRVKTHAGETIPALLYKINDALRIREEYESTSLVKIKELFDSIVVFDNYPLDKVLNRSSSLLTVDSYSMVETNHYPLTVGIAVFEKITVNFSYSTGLLDKEGIEQIARHYTSVLKEILENSLKTVGDIDILSKAEKNKILYDFNSTAAAYPKNKTIHRLFAEQADRRPDCAAVMARGQTADMVLITYKELNRKSGELAQSLKEKGVAADDMIAIMMERCLEMVIGILAVLKSGGAYLPVDPGYPEERIDYMMADSGAKVLLYASGGQKPFCKKVSGLPKTFVLHGSDVLWELNHQLPSIPLEYGYASDLCYVIYTSGSTGRPKGVMVEHGNAVNLLTWFGRTYDLHEGMHVLMLSDFTFDPSVEDILGSLVHGAAVYITGKDLVNDKEDFRRFIDKHQVHMINFVPTLLKELLSHEKKLESLQVVISGGEKLEETVKDAILARGYVLYNNYGPTEITVDALVSRCSAESVTLGKPIANTTCYIQDRNNRLVPIGVTGELCIGGAGVARGYLNEPELTAEKFCAPAPRKNFLLIKQKFLEKMYKTGDLARWLPHGNIEFLGRKDNQVKIRGHRIELGEIESRLLKYPGIKEAVVKPADDLCAYVVLQDNSLTLQDETYKVYTTAQKPSLEQKIENLHAGSWPAFFMGDEVHVRYWKRLYRSFPEFQFAITGGDDDGGETVMAAGHLIPLCLDAGESPLPGGWDDAVKKAFAGLKSNRQPNVLCGTAAIVGKEFKNKGLSYGIVKAMTRIAGSCKHKIDDVIIAVRPTLKSKFPEMAFEDYCNKKREDGFYFDPWLRVHQKLGGRVLQFAHRSQHITGTVRQWETWTGMKFERSGLYRIEGAMTPVEIDMENNRGTYFDLAVWVRHRRVRNGKENFRLPGTAELKDYLYSCLPHYMVPANIVFLNKMPLGANQKVDFHALPLPGTGAKAQYTAPTGEIEKKLADLWSRVLFDKASPQGAGGEGLSIGSHDNFFELGGHSLNATTLAARIHKKLDVKIPLVEIFKNPTLHQMAKYIKGAAKERFVSLRPLEKKEYYPLSSVQRGLYVEQHREISFTGYNTRAAVALKGEFDKDRAEKAFKRMIRRQEILRTSFAMHEDRPVQRIHDDVEFEIEYYSATVEGEITGEEASARFTRPFDLEQAPLFRVGLIKLAHREHIIIIDMHHIISDAPSAVIFEREFLLLYRDETGEKLPPLKIQYKDFCQWQQKIRQSDALKKQGAFWLEQFAGDIPMLNFPPDYPRTARQRFEGDRIGFELDEEEVKGLKELASLSNATMFMVLLAVFNVVLARRCDQEDMVVGFPSVNRQYTGLDGIIGYFVNMLAFRNYPGREKAFSSFLEEVVTHTLEVYENRDYQYDDLVEELSMTGNSVRNSLFDVVLAFQNPGILPRFSPGTGIPGLKITPYDHQAVQSPFDLILFAVESGDRLELEFFYKTSLFKKKTIERLAENYKEVISAVLTDAGIKIKEIEISHGLLTAGTQDFRQDRGDFGF